MSFSPRYLPLIDTHAHLNLSDFASDPEDFNDLIKRMRNGRFPEIRGRQVDDPALRPFISGLVCPSVDLETSLGALELAQKYDFIFAVVGFHPNHTPMIQPGDWEKVEQIVLGSLDETSDSPRRGRLVGLGETGLDRYWDDAPFELQQEYFLKTLELGLRTRLPVVIHSREANDDLEKILTDVYSDKQGFQQTFGVVHSFSGTPEQAEKFVELGFYLGFGGCVTYPNKKFADIWEAAKRVPEDRFLLETDCPFLTPHPLRGKLDRNEPLTTAFVAKRLAELRDVSTSEIVLQTHANARRLFKLPQLSETPDPV